MSRIIRPLRKNILIVCEGTVTEPEYFAVLKKMALDWAIWEEVEIRPKPRSEEEETGVTITPSPHKSQRAKRPLKEIELFDEDDEVERNYDWKQTPVSYVKEARDGLKDDTFEETWAVFDKNGHPAHKQAFELAATTLNGKIVKIAFSSIAFEHWILLHFEQNAMAFFKSECKEKPAPKKQSKSLECSSGIHHNDCWGSRCIMGYLRIKNYWLGSTKKRQELNELMSKLASKTFRHKAYENAAWLRFNIPYDENAPYLTNPYSNVDALVKRLLGEENHTIEWAALGYIKEWQSLLIQGRLNGLSFELELQNIGTSTVLINGIDIALFLHKGVESTLLFPQHKLLLPEKKMTTYTFATPIDSDVFEVRKGEKRLLFHLKAQN